MSRPTNRSILARATIALLLVVGGLSLECAQAEESHSNAPVSLGPVSVGLGSSTSSRIPAMERGEDLPQVTAGAGSRESQSVAADAIIDRLFNRIAEDAPEVLGQKDDAGNHDGNARDDVLGVDPTSLLSRSGIGGSLKAMLLMSVVSLAPAILLMTTCYVRIIVVLGLLRQALGGNSLPPNQVITSISIFITLFIMMPVWNRVYQDSLKPYTEEGSTMTSQQAWDAGVQPIREFMNHQIQKAGNQEDIYLFYRYHTGQEARPKYLEDVPLQVLLPAFMLSELKTAFLMGFMIFMPFLIIDLVVASVTISMGMMMLPPAMISLPFKLLLFVLVDGWRLVVEMLLQSFGPIN